MVIYIREKKINQISLFSFLVLVCKTSFGRLRLRFVEYISDNLFADFVVGSKKVKKSTTWSKIQCPRQTNGVDCGYYVLRFMRDIIAHNQPQIPEMYFSDCLWPNYSTEQIDEVKTELARHILYFAS
ncbi:uncharacterized protein LOC110708335 isoform X1 [Chenopodium quinoa]|uniref:uncharacterized protein LOC110708335 isoform X1 n=1 Tax=Chenopodium quinoa TaxID=63459 RepID=UPI000B794442|nr:uncharacterized protein LOC110708335 isoform X1 [Chenopodium quinoa]